MPQLLESTENSVRYLTLNRPEKRNALNAELIADLTSAVTAASADDQLYAIVIMGAGKDFCAGADLASLQKIATSSFDENLADAQQLTRLFDEMRNARHPVIAAVRGRALAGGSGLATACDLVVASESARFGYPEVKIGFVPAIVTAFLRRNVSEKRAFELITRGDEFSASEALEMGLINRVFADGTFEQDVEKYVDHYRCTSRSAVRLSKRLFYAIDALPFADALNAGAQVNAEARMTADCRQGIAKFLNK